MYRLNLFTLKRIAGTLEYNPSDENLEYWVTEYVFKDDFNYGANHGVGCKNKSELLKKLYWDEIEF